VQKDIIFGSRYPYISLANPPFQGDIVILDAKFIFILEIEVKLIVCDEASASPPTGFDPANHLQFYTALSVISFGDIVYIIAIGVI
jgi:hypothetical protein